MGITSYAQNLEDVMLWRALKNVKNGFYIDVGAAWPDKHSVTKAFYDNGWSGINIEPNPIFINQYPLARPNDINLQVAISDKCGKEKISFVENTGLSSLDADIAKSHHEMGFDITIAEVKIKTLDKICKKYVKRSEIHFLKVDVEGLEKNVLLGNNWTAFRPWIVVVEAMLPLRQEQNHAQWEYILLESGYLFAYADGLNRFYVSRDHSELISSFKYPPNIFDGFVSSSQVEAEAKANEAINNYNLIINSLSWKITYPLRIARSAINWFMVRGIAWITFAAGSRPRRIIKQILIYLKYRIYSSPRLKSKILTILVRFPSLKLKLKSIYNIANNNIQMSPIIHGTSQRGNQIYNKLKNIQSKVIK